MLINERNKEGLRLVGGAPHFGLGARASSTCCPVTAEVSMNRRPSHSLGHGPTPHAAEHVTEAEEVQEEAQGPRGIHSNY